MEVPLTRGLVAVIDDEDYDLISDYRWHAVPGRATHYARTNAPRLSGGYSPLPMHRLILGLDFGDRRQGDHRDGNGLNNRRSNLRIVTQVQNMRNRPGDRETSSRHKGVSLYRSGKWQAYIYSGGKRHHLGYFTDEIDAARAYDLAAADMHREHARLNFP